MFLSISFNSMLREGPDNSIIGKKYNKLDVKRKSSDFIMEHKNCH